MVNFQTTPKWYQNQLLKVCSSSVIDQLCQSPLTTQQRDANFARHPKLSFESNFLSDNTAECKARVTLSTLTHITNSSILRSAKMYSTCSFRHQNQCCQIGQFHSLLFNWEGNFGRIWIIWPLFLPFGQFPPVMFQ